MANNYRDYVQINNQKIAPQVPTANKIRDPGPCWPITPDTVPVGISLVSVYFLNNPALRNGPERNFVLDHTQLSHAMLPRDKHMIKR